MTSRAHYIIIAILLIGVSLYLINSGLTSKQASQETIAKPPVVIRVDDIQDYAFREAQLQILKLSSEKQVPLSLSIIPKIFTSDKELIDAVKAALLSGSEATAHGWLHEDFRNSTLMEQVQKLTLAKRALNRTLGVETTILVPPLFDYNQDTLHAMKLTGYDTISSTTDLQNPGPTIYGIMGLPSTVNFSTFINDTWKPKTLQQLENEVDLSVSMHGYAMIVIHPQELLNGDSMNTTTTKTLDDLMTSLSGKYSLKTIAELSKTIQNTPNGGH